MTVKELKEVLNAYPEDMEVVLDSPLGYCKYYNLETNDNNQVVIY